MDNMDNVVCVDKSKTLSMSDTLQFQKQNPVSTLSSDREVSLTPTSQEGMRRHSLSTAQQLNILSLSYPTLTSKTTMEPSSSKVNSKTLSHSNLPDLLQIPTIANRCPSPFPSLRKPLVLPPPPAAHLPPSLPSRPPAGTPCGRPPSSLSIRLESTQSSPSASPCSEKPLENARISSSHPNLLYRSCGSIKIDAPTGGHNKLTRGPATKNISERTNTRLNSITSKQSTQDPVVPDIRVSLATSSETAGIIDTVNNLGYTEKTTTTQGRNSAPEQENNIRSKRSKELVQTNAKIGWFFKKKTDGEDARQNIIPPEISSLRHAPLSVVDVLTSALLVYKKSQSALSKNKNDSGTHHTRPPQCTHCDRNFGLLCARLTCNRCKKSFCDRCVQKRISSEADQSISPTQIMCVICVGETERETSRGVIRGLWSEFQHLRLQARRNSEQPKTQSNFDRLSEMQDIHDITPGLYRLCQRFLQVLHQHLEKNTKHSFFTGYLHTDNSIQKSIKATKKMTECPSCSQQVRLLQDSLECSLCQRLFCYDCTYQTLQLYLPIGTDLKQDICYKQIKVHIMSNERDEITRIEASELYRVCGQCEVLVQKNVQIIEFNMKIPEIEQEMFDLQRQIDDALSYNPSIFNLTRSRSSATINAVGDDDMMINIKRADKLYDRYMRQYDLLNHMSPATPGQKLLHQHVKQAMYEFYLKRRSQLKTSLRRRDSCISLKD